MNTHDKEHGNRHNVDEKTHGNESAHEPSMDEILASIRRIISSDKPSGGKTQENQEEASDKFAYEQDVQQNPSVEHDMQPMSSREATYALRPDSGQPHSPVHTTDMKEQEQTFFSNGDNLENGQAGIVPPSKTHDMQTGHPYAESGDHTISDSFADPSPVSQDFLVSYKASPPGSSPASEKGEPLPQQVQTEAVPFSQTPENIQKRSAFHHDDRAGQSNTVDVNTVRSAESFPGSLPAYEGHQTSSDEIYEISAGGEDHTEGQHQVQGEGFHQNWQDLSPDSISDHLQQGEGYHPESVPDPQSFFQDSRSEHNVVSSPEVGQGPDAETQELLQPLIQAWLEENLPALVEREVRSQIKQALLYFTREDTVL